MQIILRARSIMLPNMLERPARLHQVKSESSSIVYSWITSNHSARCNRDSKFEFHILNSVRHSQTFSLEGERRQDKTGAKSKFGYFLKVLGNRSEENTSAAHFSAKLEKNYRYVTSDVCTIGEGLAEKRSIAMSSPYNVPMRRA